MNVWYVKQRLKQFLDRGPITRVFLAAMLSLGFIPLAIAFGALLCFTVVLLLTFVVIEGTFFAITMTNLMAALVGPILIAVCLTVAFQGMSRFVFILRSLAVKCTMMVGGISFAPKEETIEKRHETGNWMSGNERFSTEGNIFSPEDMKGIRDYPYLVTFPSNTNEKGKRYRCKFCRENRHELCISKEMQEREGE